MWTPVLKPLAALALCLPLVTAPAPARSDDMAKALAAIFGLALIGAAIHENNSAQAGQAAVAPRPLPPRARPKLLPNKCLRRVDGFAGQTRLLSRHCLMRHYPLARHLPDRCSLRIHSFAGTQHGYSPRCLRQHGYRIARR